jgi:apolipoprotein N-acyltransferase
VTAQQADATPSRIHVWLAGLKPWRRHGLGFIAGALATLGHAPFQLTLVYVVAIVALVWLLDAASKQKRRLRAAFATGLAFGFGHFLTGVYWVAFAFQVDAESWGAIWGVPATLALALGLGLFWGLGAVLAMLIWTSDVRRIAAFALGMFASEWLRGHVFGGFPWLLPAYVWTPGEPVSQAASIAGAYGLSLLTLLVAATPAAIADVGANALRRFGPMIAAALAVGMTLGWGAQRLAHAEVDAPGAQPVVRVTDSGLSQSEKWEPRPDQEWRVLDRYLEASGSPDDSRASIVIWPEGAIPVLNFFALDNPSFLLAIGQGMGDRVLIAGFSRQEQRGARRLFFNSAAIIDGVSGEPRLSQIYDKHHLVPFGEYIPLWSIVSAFNIAPLQRIGAGFESGDPPTRLVVPEAPPAIVLICYEAIFPGMTPHGDERPGWIVSITNDAWFGGGTGPFQHYAIARYRSIEEGLPMARAASGGVSAIIDAYGRAVRSTYRQGGYAEAQLPPALAETFWARYGEFVLLGLIVIIAGLRIFPLTDFGAMKS